MEKLLLVFKGCIAYIFLVSQEDNGHMAMDGLYCFIGFCGYYGTCTGLFPIR